MASNRALGFSVDFKASTELEKKFEALTAKALEFGKAIKTLKDTPLKLSFDIKDIKSLESISVLLKGLGKSGLDQNTLKQIKDLQKEVANLKKQLIDANKQITGLQQPKLSSAEAKDLDNTLKQVGISAAKVEDTVSLISPALQKLESQLPDNLFRKFNELNGVIKTTKTQIDIINKSNLSEDDKNSLIDQKTAELKIYEAELKDTNKEIAQHIAAEKQLSSSFPKDSIIGMRLEVTKLNHQLNGLSKAEREGAKGKELERAILARTTVINKHNEALNRFQHNVGNYKSAFATVGTSVAGFSNIITGGLIGGGILGFVTGLTTLGKTAIKEFEEAEIAITKVDTLVKQTGKSAGFTTAQLKQMADELGKANNIDNDKILNSVTAQLLVFDKITGQTFAKAQKLAIDIGKTFEGGLEGASSTIGKILTFPESSTKLLKQFGIDLSKQEEKRIKQLVDQNKLQEAQLILVEKLEKFSGQGLAQAATQMGRFKALIVEFNEKLEDVGRGIVALGIGFLDLVDNIYRGTLFMSDADKILTRSKQDLNKKISEESLFIDTNIRLLKDHNVQGKFRQETIDKLTAKYPDLITKQDLVYASEKRLGDIQKDLTANLEKNISDRLLLRELEALETQRINNKVKIAELKSKDTSSDNFALIELTRIGGAVTFDNETFTNPQKVLNERRKKLAEEEARTLEDSNVEIGKTMEERRKLYEQASSDNKNNVNQINADFETLNKAISASIDDLNAAIQNPSTDKNNIKGLQDLINKLLQFDGALTDQTSQEVLQSIRKLLSDSSSLIANASKDNSTKLTDAQKAAAEKAAQEYQKQLDRIEELRRKNADKSADLIANEFDKKLEQAKLKAKNEIADLEKEAKALEKGGLTTKDKEQIAKIKEQTDLINSALRQETTAIETERKAAIDKFKQELIDARSELITIINDTNTKQSQSAIDTELFNQDKRISQLKHDYEQDKLNLDIALRDKKISQQDYDKQSLILTGIYTANVEKEVRRSNAVLKKLYEEQANIRKLSLEKQADIDKAQTTKTFQDEVSGIDHNASTQQKLQAVATYELKRKAAIEAIEKELASSVLGINQELQKELQALRANELAAHKANAEAKVAITKKQAKAIEAIILALTGIKIDIKVSISEEEKEKLLKFRDAAVQVAEEISRSIFAIENNQSEAGFDKRKSDLEHEYDNRKKLAKGNTAEIERLEREKDQKLKNLEREQAKRRKEQAVKEAIINTALGIIKAIPNIFLMAFAALAGGLQIAIINSQKFAKGGRITNKPGDHTGYIGSQAPPDETGQRPIPIVAHDGEHMSTARQVTDNPDLYKIIEKDRVRTNSGQGSKLTEDIIRFAEIKKRALYGESINPKPKYERVIPMIIPVASSRVQKIEFTDEQLDKMADILANRIADKTGSAVFQGSSQGITNASKEAIREERRLQKSQV